MDEARGRRVPEGYVDPRNTQSYHYVSVFQKVMALKTFEHKVIAFLRGPVLDQDGIDRMIHNREWVLNLPYAPNMDPESTSTLEKVREASIELILDNFYDVLGMEEHSYCLDVILGGWQAFLQALLTCVGT